MVVDDQKQPILSKFASSRNKMQDGDRIELTPWGLVMNTRRVG